MPQVEKIVNKHTNVIWWAKVIEQQNKDVHGEIDETAGTKTVWFLSKKADIKD